MSEMTTTCAEISETLSALLDGEETPEENATARAHLDECADCRRTTADWGAIDLAVAASTAERAPVRVLRRRGRRRAPALLAASLAIALTAATAVFAGLGSPPSREEAAGGGARTTGRATSSSPAPRDESKEAGAGVVVRQGAEETPKLADEPSDRPYSGPTDPSGKGGPARGYASDRELTLMVWMDRTFFRAGEQIAVGTVLGNTSDHEVTFWAHAESPFDLVLRGAAGAEVYRRSAAEGWANEPAERTLRPNEYTKEAISFAAPAPGAYQLTVECLCVRGFTPPEGEQAPSSGPRDGTTVKERPYGRLETTPIKVYVGPGR